ncbi:MAG: iron ABC transporter permease [Deltaproteobacteria bacterium]|nr:iron ABC transporter permease [Deltaproteobacteria bacterium]
MPFEPGPWSLSNYIRVFTSAESYLLFQNSLVFALCTVVAAVAISVVLVWLIERTDIPDGDLLFALILMPLGMPGLIKAIGWTFLASPRIGAFNVALRNILGIEGNSGPLNIYSLSGMIFVSALSMVPSIVLMLSGVFRSFDPALEEASEVSGASKLQTQRLVTMPLLRPALLGAFIYYLADALDNFQIPAILGLNAGIHVYSTRIYLAANPVSGFPDYGLASGYAMLLFLLALVLIVLYRRMMKKAHRFVVITGKGYRPQRFSLGKWKYAAFMGVALYLLLGAISPMLILLWVSFQPFFNVLSTEAFARLTVSNYVAIWNLSQFRVAAVNTVTIALIVATATMVLATLTAWMAVRGRFRGSSIPDFLTFINTAVPSVVFGLAVMLVYLSFSIIPIYGTIWIIIIAFVTRYLTFTTRLIGGAVVQIDKQLEEASETSGASLWITLRRVTVPLILPSFLSGWLWVAVHALREATIAVMLTTRSNVVLSSLIWERFHEGRDQGLVAAMSVVVMGLCMLLTFFGRRALLSERN